MSFVALTIIDRRYVGWASILAQSIARNSPAVELHVLSIDLPADDIAILRNGGCVQIEPVHEKLETPEAIVNTRARLLLHYWKQRFPDRAILLLDADFLVRASLEPLFLASAAYDAAICFRPGMFQGKRYKRLSVAGGLALFQPSGRSLLEAWIERMTLSLSIEDVQPNEWFWDQICLADVCETATCRIMPIPVPYYLSSPPFDETAAIWSANVKPWEKIEIYQQFQNELAS